MNNYLKNLKDIIAGKLATQTLDMLTDNIKEGNFYCILQVDGFVITEDIQLHCTSWF